MRRWKLHIAAALSALLFLLVISLWVRSYWRWDVLMYSANIGHHYRARWIDSAAGLVGFFWSNGEAAELSGTDSGVTLSHSSSENYRKLYVEGESTRGALGFYIYRNTYTSPTWSRTRRSMWIPHWALLLPLMIAPARWIRHWRDARRVRAGCCRVCGYDLRASPTRCPECGTPR